MGQQQATIENVKSITAAALVGLALVISGKVGSPTPHLDTMLSCVAKETMGLVPYITPAAWRALQSYVFDQQGFSPCHLQILVSCWSLLQLVAGAA